MSIVEFAGMPKSGKTTILEIVRHELRRSGSSTADYHGGGRYAPIQKGHLPDLNLYLACEAMKYIAATVENGSRDMNLHLMDRGVFDRVIFTHALHQRGAITAEECNALTEALLLPRLVDAISHVFVFVASPSLSMERELHNKLNRKAGTVMNPDALMSLRRAALECAERFGNRFSHLRVVDTEEIDGNPMEGARQVLSSLAKAGVLEGV